MKNVYGLLTYKRISTHFWEVFPNYGIYVLVNFIHKICLREGKKNVFKAKCFMFQTLSSNATPNCDPFSLP